MDGSSSDDESPSIKDSVRSGVKKVEDETAKKVEKLQNAVSPAAGKK